MQLDQSSENLLKGVEVKREWVNYPKDLHYRYHLYIFGAKLGEFKDCPNTPYRYVVVSLVDEKWKDHGLAIMWKWRQLKRAERKAAEEKNFAEEVERQREEKRKLQQAVARQQGEASLPPGQCNPSGDRFWSWLFGVRK